jgi:hypothetical protein
MKQKSLSNKKRVIRRAVVSSDKYFGKSGLVLRGGSILSSFVDTKSIKKCEYGPSLSTIDTDI